MFDSIKKLIKNGRTEFFEQSKSRNEWIQNHKSQAVAVVL